MGISNCCGRNVDACDLVARAGYIRNEADGREQLFHESDDPDEQVNLAKVAAMRPRLVRLRRRLD
jgi:hypothetical protein